MAILITTARFTADGAPGAVTAPAERVEAAARQLIARVAGTVIGCYRTSGDNDVLLIFEAPSYEDAASALDAAAAGSGMIELKTVRVLAAHETKPAHAGSRPGAVIPATEGVNAAQRAAAEPGAHPPSASDAATASETEADAKAAARILEARKKSTEDIAAGRPAPYYLATPTAPAPSRPTPARARKDDDGSAKR